MGVLTPRSGPVGTRTPQGAYCVRQGTRRAALLLALSCSCVSVTSGRFELLMSSEVVGVVQSSSSMRVVQDFTPLTHHLAVARGCNPRGRVLEYGCG